MELKRIMKEIFCDGIAEINYTHGLVICDLYHLIPIPGERGEMEPNVRITMPLVPFLRVFQSCEKVVDFLTQDGVFTKDAEPVSIPAPQEKTAAAKQGKTAAKKPAAKPAAPAKKAETPAKPAPAKKAAPAAKAPAKTKGGKASK